MYALKQPSAVSLVSLYHLRPIRACVCALRGRYTPYYIIFILLRNLYDTSDTDTEKCRPHLTFSRIAWYVTALIQAIQVRPHSHYRFDTRDTQPPQLLQKKSRPPAATGERETIHYLKYLSNCTR